MQGAKTSASGVGSFSRALVTAPGDAGGWQMWVVDADIHAPPIGRSFRKPLGAEAPPASRLDVSTRKCGP